MKSIKNVQAKPKKTFPWKAYLSCEREGGPPAAHQLKVAR